MQKKSVGRPAKPRARFFSLDASPDIISNKADCLAALLPDTSRAVVNDLASVSVSFNLMKQLQKKTDLAGKGRGRRATIHIGMLYAECALVHEKHSQHRADEVLRSLGGWEEEARALTQEPEVIAYAKAILRDSGVRLGGSHRQQIRNGLKYLGISPLFHAVTP